MLLVHLFVCFVCVSHFSLPLGVGCCLRFVIVALPGLLSTFFFQSKYIICMVLEDVQNGIDLFSGMY